jgi:hypothetical protein
MHYERFIPTLLSATLGVCLWVTASAAQSCRGIFQDPTSFDDGTVLYVDATSRTWTPVENGVVPSNGRSVADLVYVARDTMNEVVTRASW